MSDIQLKFQQLLRELFQFNSADLDFGIYRIMNHKRDVVELFITEGLPKAIADELDSGALAEQALAQKELTSARQKVLDALGDDALDTEENLVEQYHTTPAGKAYVDAQAKAVGTQDKTGSEAAIYNHLYTFFSRYYQDGDFISKRRYSGKGRYSIPYNGEEVYLYWANHDQYYIKTAEQFVDYAWKGPNGVSVRFKLDAAEAEQGNGTGQNRFFLPLQDEIAWDEKNVTLTIPFEYRPLTEQESITYGKSKQQDKIVTAALDTVPKKLSKHADALTALMAERRKTSEGNSVSHFDHHLHQYTARNTRDFFIHQDLSGFLSRELDFYLKNEVVNLEEMVSAGEELSEGWFQRMRLVKRVGSHIIEFLVQIEEFQKMLWEKRKFVTETFYCITVGSITQDFYGEIAKNQAQWNEWQELYAIDPLRGKKKRMDFLKNCPTLVLDTRHFDEDFVDRILASFSNLDETVDGLVVHSENWQALNLLREKYWHRLDCAHIDPPYNTQTSGFLYKNDYQHSSWLAMMHNRITASLPLLHSNAAFLCHIDENEYEVLHLLFTSIGIPDGGTVIWDKKNPMLGRKGIATQHEYILWRTWADSSPHLRPTNIRIILSNAESLIGKNGGVNEEVRREFRDWINEYEGLTGGERAYRLIDDDGRVFQSVAMGAPEPRSDPKFHIPLTHPVTGKECPVPSNGWSRAPETLQDLVEKNEIVFGDDETVQPRRKVFLTADTGRQVSSVVGDSGRGKNDMTKLGLEFPYCHPVSLYVELLGAAIAESGQIVLDHFAGSGTTAHAVITLNRSEGGNRKFIMVEMAEYFDTVLLPRIKKVTFSPEWRGGKPERSATPEEAERSPRIVKVLRLESYEDVLNNIEIDDASGQQAMQFEDYPLRYMLKWETRKGQTLLDVKRLSRPFSYKLNIHRNGEFGIQHADMPETFNYLIGLDVETRKVFIDNGRRYLAYRGKTRDGRAVAIIWRETDGWRQEDWERDREFVAEQGMAKGADEVFVNGDSFIPNAQSLDGLFKSRLFAAVEA